ALYSCRKRSQKLPELVEMQAYQTRYQCSQSFASRDSVRQVPSVAGPCLSPRHSPSSTRRLPATVDQTHQAKDGNVVGYAPAASPELVSLWSAAAVLFPVRLLVMRRRP